MDILELDNEQRKYLVDTQAAYRNYREAEQDKRRLRGSMTWKHVAGHDYLARSKQAGRWKSLGPRSLETEKTYEAFYAQKTAANERYRRLREQIKRRVRYAKANKINRVPKSAASVLRVFEQNDVPVLVAGTSCLFAYEVMAGVQFDSSLTATEDLDLIFHPQRRLRIMCDAKPHTILSLLQRADKSFAKARHASFRAINKAGFMVDVITFPLRPLTRNPNLETAPGDLEVVEIEKLDWLASAPVLEIIAIAEDGIGVRMRVPHPACFAMHKWLIAQKPDRSPVKKPRDLSQAAAMVRLIDQYLPQYALSEAVLSVFPQTLCNQFATWHQNQNASSQSGTNSNDGSLGPGL